MASPLITFRRRRLARPETSDRDRGTWVVPAFAIASVTAHAAVWIVLATLPSSGIAVTVEDATIEFELAPLPEPEPAPAIVPEPEPEPEPERVRLTPRQTEPPPAASEPPPIVVEDVGVHSTEGGLAVDAVEATGDGGGVIAARPASVHEPRGEAGSNGDGETARPAIDHRRLAREWMNEVNRAVMMRAVRDYPRAARRSRLEGTVLVSIAVDPNGRITTVNVMRGAGHETLDRAAIAAVQAVGTLPQPPDVFNRRGRPLTMPISYRLR